MRDHDLFLSLGNEAVKRQKAYRALFRSELNAQAIADIRKSANAGLPLGVDWFKEELASALGWRVTPGKAGRCKRDGVQGIDGEQTGFEF